MLTQPEHYRGPGSALPMAEPAPFDWLAVHFMESGAVDSARMALEYGAETGWSTERSALVQAWVWESNGFLTKADSGYRALIASDPDNPEYRRALATLGWKPFRARPAVGRAKESQGGGRRTPSSPCPCSIRWPARIPGTPPCGWPWARPITIAACTPWPPNASTPASRPTRPCPAFPQKRDLAYEAALRESAWALRQAGGRTTPRAARPVGEEKTPVVLPSAIAPARHLRRALGQHPVDVRPAYPGKTFRNLPGGNLMDEFVLDGVHHIIPAGLRGTAS